MPAIRARGLGNDGAIDPSPAIVLWRLRASGSAGAVPAPRSLRWDFEKK